MAEFDHGSKMIAQTAGRQLARLAGVDCTHWQPAESTIQASVERLADRVFLAGRGRRRFAVYFEFYTTWDRHAPWDMLGKSGLISQRERLPTVCIAVVLRRTGFITTGGNLRLVAPSGPTQQLWLREVCLWNIKPETWWDEESGLMILYPLCQHGKRPGEAIIHAAGVIEAKVSAAGERAERLALLSIFVGLAFPTLDIEEIIGSEKMKESRILRRIRIEDILRVLRARFRTEPPADMASALECVLEGERLDNLLDLAATCEDIDVFRTGMMAEQTT